MTSQPIADLRQRVQVPVREFNDVAGYLIGDHVSIHVTRMFLRLGLSPTVATISMLAFGLGGSVMLLFGERAAVAGLICVFVYYICDCVDGEVARYHKQEKLIWGFIDYLFHLIVKSAFFVCMGVAAFVTVGDIWILIPALAALLATLFQKFLWDLPTILITHEVLLKSPEQHGRFLPQVIQDLDPGPESLDRVDPGTLRISSLGRPLGLFRAALVNFDISVLVFLVAAVADLFLAPFEIDNHLWNLKVLLLCFYGVVLPIDFADKLWSHFRRGTLFKKSAHLLRRAHHFRLRKD